MTAPRAILPGRYLFVTRRCTQRQFLLKPSETTNAAILYCFAEAARRFGVQIVALTVMSNHYHAVFYDADGVLPAFLAHVHKMVAKVMNCRWGRWENLWASEPSCIVECETPEDVFGKSVYTLTNGVRHHLVDKAVDWPGASTLLLQLKNKDRELRRPAWFFDPNGRMPEVVTLSTVRPRGFAHLSHDQWACKLRDAIARAEEDAARQRREDGIELLGRRTVLKQSPFGRPKGATPRRNLRPRVACRSKWHRVDLLRRCKVFRARYREALEKLRAGVRDVVFPAGTYLLRVRGLVDCEPMPAPT